MAVLSGTVRDSHFAILNEQMMVWRRYIDAPHADRLSIPGMFRRQIARAL
jgi:hypothetical protein